MFAQRQEPWFDDVQREPLAAGARIGIYRIESLLGAGGFGLTYSAIHPRLGRVALKEYFPRKLAYRDMHVNVQPVRGYSDIFELGRQKFLAEARTLRQLRHPGIMVVHDHIEDRHNAYMVLEFISGTPLSSALGDGGVLGQVALDDLVRKLCPALAVVHRAGKLHCDIAPDNVMLRAGNIPVLIDFGAARQAVVRESDPLGLALRVVKSGYSPPEQYEQNGSLGPWSDIYSLAATLYRCVTGAAPPPCDARGRRYGYKPATEIAKGSYRRLFLKAIDRGLSLDPGARPQSVEEFQAALLRQSSWPRVLGSAALGCAVLSAMAGVHGLYQRGVETAQIEAQTARANEEALKRAREREEARRRAAEQTTEELRRKLAKAEGERNGSGQAPRGPQPPESVPQALALAPGPAPAPRLLEPPRPVQRPASADREWVVQVGAFQTEKEARRALVRYAELAEQLLARRKTAVQPFERDGKTLWRARFLGFERDSAREVCDQLKSVQPLVRQAANKPVCIVGRTESGEA